MIALIVAECHRHLMHIQGSVQVVQAVLLHVVVEISCSSVHLVTIGSVTSQSDIQIHFNVWISTVIDCVEGTVLALVDSTDHVAWE